MCVFCCCATQRDDVDGSVATLQNARDAVTELRVGMTEPDVMAVLKRHGLEISGVTGGTMSWCAAAILPDQSGLVLNFRFESRELRDKGPSKLTGWRVIPRKREGTITE